MNRATEMDITMIGLQNAGKTSLLRVLAVRIPTRPPNKHRTLADTDICDEQGGEFTLEYVPLNVIDPAH
jgi:GTPase SAR1 family protein